MLIGWATPFNIRSAIGKFSRAVADELHARGHGVVILRLETGPELQLAPLETDFEVISADKADLDAFDEMIVNFGNHAPYHSQAVSIIARRAPLAIFHDAEMRDFEWGLDYRHGFRLPRLVGLEQQLEREAREDEFVTPEAAAVLGSIAAMSWGAVVHGPHYEPTVARFCPGPVKIIPLCYPDPGTHREHAPKSPGRRIVIFGVISEHKQPRRVMRALALLKDSVGPVELHLAGSIEDRTRADLLKEASDLGIQPPIIHGYVAEDRLQAIIEDADAICCLRFPVTEGGSASLATALYRERPVIVANVASYSMVPDEVAYKVSYGEDAGDLAAVLRDIFKAPAKAEAKARKARKWAETAFSARAYTDALLSVLEVRQAPRVLAGLARQLAPAVVDPSGTPVPSAVSDLAEVLDWMDASQGGPGD